MAHLWFFFQYISDKKMLDWRGCDSSISHLQPEQEPDTTCQPPAHQNQYHLVIMLSPNIDGAMWQPKESEF